MTWVGLVGVLVGLGCPADDVAMEDPDDGASEAPPPPSFEDPPSLELVVSASEIQDITLAVAGLRYDTRVEIDGSSWALGGSGPAGLEGDELRLALGGAMVVGRHELALAHKVGSVELRSELVEIQVVPSMPGSLSATLQPEQVDSGDHLVVHGQGSEAVLGVVDSASARVQVRAGAWSAAGFELELPGLVMGGAMGGVGGAGLDLSVVPGVGDEQARWVVAAYLADDGATVYARIVSVTGPGLVIGDPGEPFAVWSLDDDEQAAALGPHELARIEAVTLLDRMVVLGVEARRDAETSSPGDRLLVTRWLASNGAPALPVLLRGPNSSDLDLPGDARLWNFAGHDAALGVRVGLGFPWLLTIGGNGLPSLGSDPGQLASVPVAATWMRSADGAFGSRHAFALEGGPQSPRLRVVRINRWSEQADDPNDIVDLVELPAMPTGSPSLALLDGVPTLVMPMGSELDVLALRSTGVDVMLESLAGLRCDEVAVVGPSFDGVGDTLPLACLSGGELRTGVLRVD
ncbi:hypothetical protein DB30_00247 [Enhygromyxa salina]|uniref:Uncharacterized protein n=1 Tax=Enhygromyxa salina TaxID=215803 RepID=A0A0C2DFW9_9BACT|nr:hypothetical protein DB30_00247 [Enhygromyxa salina]